MKIISLIMLMFLLSVSIFCGTSDKELEKRWDNLFKQITLGMIETNIMILATCKENGEYEALRVAIEAIKELQIEVWDQQDKIEYLKQKLDESTYNYIWKE